MAGLANFDNYYNNVYNGGIVGNMGSDGSYSWTPDANSFLSGSDLGFGGGTSSNWLSDAFSGGNLGNTLSGIAAIGSGIMSGITGFQSLGMANKNLSLAKKQFNFQKGLANRNLANQAKTINNTYDSAASVNAAQAGKFGMVDQAVVDKYAQVAKEKHVDGSAI